jgi:Domain of unknown function (DUF3943)
MNVLLSRICYAILLVTISAQLYAQKPVKIVPAKGDRNEQLKEIKDDQSKAHTDSIGKESTKSTMQDTTRNNKYADLLNDDPVYNKRYPFWIPAVEVLAINGFVWSMDHYVMHADYAEISLATWQSNIKQGWEWDTDRFGINFIGHPYSGTMSFNAGRSNGYNYFQSFGFSVAGSLMWEYFGENTRPSYNDIINTPINGAFLGEIFYRLSSNILDDRSRGRQRFYRELLAGVVDPVRGLNRLIQGKTFQKTLVEVYQKEPLNVTMFAGIHDRHDGTGPIQMLNVQFDYGNPFENRFRKPFDFFKLRTDLSFGAGRKILDNITGYGILTGRNSQKGKLSILTGAFQYFDYWDNKTFELGTIGFGGGVFTKMPVGKKSTLYTNVHLAFVPFGGQSRLVGPDSSQVRDYDFSGGMEGKVESTFNLGKVASATFVYYYYFLHTYQGLPQNNFVGIFRPRITLRVYKAMSLGYEHFIYTDDRYYPNVSVAHKGATEDKIFLLIYLEDRQRRGRYN